jgi:hypothetical protein
LREEKKLKYGFFSFVFSSAERGPKWPVARE